MRSFEAILTVLCLVVLSCSKGQDAHRQTAKFPGYRVEYVDRPVRTCGAGEIIQIAGYGYLLVQMMPTQAHTNEGKPTIKEQSYAPGLQLIKEMKRLCDFEADVQWVLGLSSPNRYRVLELTNPARLVIDVRH